MNGFKFIETLEITFEKDTIDSKTGKHVNIYKTAFFNGKAKIVSKVDDLEPELNMSRQEILNTIDKMGFRRFRMGHRSNRESLHKRYPI